MIKLCIFSTFLLFAWSSVVQGFSTTAKTALVIDNTTGDVLLSKDIDRPIPPASMSKLMTLLKNIDKEKLLYLGGELDCWKKISSQDEKYGFDYNCSPDDDFNIIYSSGTTGVPKGIVQTHRARSHWATSNAIEMSFNSECKSLTTTALYSNGTWLMMLPTLFVGGTLHVMNGFDAKAFVELVKRESITHTFLVPPQFSAILSLANLEKDSFNSLKTILSAGSPLRLDVKEKILKSMSKNLFELYGFSEGFATMLKPHNQRKKISSVGTPVLGFEIKIIDEKGMSQEGVAYKLCQESFNTHYGR